MVQTFQRRLFPQLGPSNVNYELLMNSNFISNVFLIVHVQTGYLFLKIVPYCFA